MLAAEVDHALADLRRQVEQVQAEWRADLAACRAEDADPYTRGCADAIELRIDALDKIKERL